MNFKYDCRLFTGYKPCKYKRSCQGCTNYDPVKTRVCLVSLEALGAVIRSTCLLPAIKRKFPRCHITFVTKSSSKALLMHNPYIDRVVFSDSESPYILNFLEFDIAYGVDKSLEAGALVESLKAEQKFGFGLDPSGYIRPLNIEAEYQFMVGLDDELKFYKNQKPETQQITESMGLEWVRDEYVLQLNQSEMRETTLRRSNMLLSSKANFIIGYNTGCSTLFPYKKLTIEKSIELIKSWRSKFPNAAIALYGGREDSQRQLEMKNTFADDAKVINTPANEGLRSGIIWENTCDVLFSGCSLGKHIGIALKKPIVAWYGVSCRQEIDLYDRGVQIQSPVACAPCWKKTCDKNPKCFDEINIEEVCKATGQLLKEHNILS